MMSQDRDIPVDAPAGYEAPRIDAVLTQEQLAREVLYAGFVSGPA
jgi:hypothetical protein